MKVVDRLKPDGPKRILALDGGGIRGALSLGYLGEIEKILRDRHQKPNLLLCDYFDRYCQLYKSRLGLYPLSGVSKVHIPYG